MDQNGKEGSFIEHLEELRNRLIVSIVYLAAGTMIGLGITQKYLLKFILAPIEQIPEAHLQVLGPVEKFAAYFKTAMAAGIVFAAPFILLQIWLFVRPGLHKHERRFIGWFIPISMFLFILGASFIYYVLLPTSLSFLLGFDLGVDIDTAITLDRYFSFVIVLVLSGGTLFQIPLLAYFLARFGILSPSMLSSRRQYAILIATALAAFITPTSDPINLLLLTVPIYILFEISIVVARFSYRKRRESEE